jgi:hypothetical protein
MNYVLLDTNVFVNDFWMRGNEFNIFLNNYHACVDVFLLPKVINDEIINQYLKKTEEVKKNAVKSFRNINMYSRDKIDFDLIVNEKISYSEYVKFVDQNIKKFDCTVVEYPSINHQTIAQKAMKRKKPFKEKGDGYCDALIWENIKEFLNKEECNTLHFITSNHKDFFDNRQLAYDLRLELQEQGIEEDKIKIYSGLNDFNTNNIVPLLTKKDTITSKLKDNSFDDFDFNEWIMDKIFDEINFDPELYDELTGPIPEGEIIIEEIYDVKCINVLDESLTSNGEIYIELDITVSIGANLCAGFYEYLKSDFIKHVFDLYEGGMYDEYQCIRLDEDIQMNISLIFKDEITDSQVAIYNMSQFNKVFK